MVVIAVVVMVSAGLVVREKREVSGLLLLHLMSTTKGLFCRGWLWCLGAKSNDLSRRPSELY